MTTAIAAEIPSVKYPAVFCLETRSPRTRSFSIIPSSKKRPLTDNTKYDARSQEFIFHNKLACIEYFPHIDTNILYLNERVIMVLEKLGQIKNLNYNWNGYGAEPFSPNVVRRVEETVPWLKYVPEVYPTANGTIQLEYHKLDGSYLEIEMGRKEQVSVYIEFSDGEEREFEASYKASELNRIVGDFYGR